MQLAARILASKILVESLEVEISEQKVQHDYLAALSMENGQNTVFLSFFK